MRVIYIADDGKEFDEEFDCMDYEWRLNHPFLKDILLYDEHNEKLNDILSQNTYNRTEKVIVPSEESLNEIRELASYAGFCAYDDIVECGEWVFNCEKGTFVKA